MPKNKYKVVEYEGYRFFFKYDNLSPDLLHIFARRMFSLEDAIEVWFEGTFEIEIEEFERIETFTRSLGIYWFWLDDEQSKVMIVSCFKRSP